VRDNSSDEASTQRGLHHEDLAVGDTFDCGRSTVTREDILAFGRAYDPQPLHVDEAAAKATPLGGLCASVWHTCCVMMRLAADGMLNRVVSLGSPGVEEGRWMMPVRPGDVVSCRYTVLEKRDLASRPDVGIAKVRVELCNRKGDILAHWGTHQLTRRRHPGPAPSAPPARRERKAITSLWGECASASPLRPDLYFEDRQLGELTDLGTHTFAKDEIIAFARQFDPQPFHLDEAAAKASLFGGLCASGWHSAAIAVKGDTRARLEGNKRARAEGVPLAAYGPAPGFCALSWPRPVYAGDTLEYRGRLAQKIDLKSSPDRGILATEMQARNQRGEIVFRVRAHILAERREPYRGV